MPARLPLQYALPVESKLGRYNRMQMIKRRIQGCIGSFMNARDGEKL